MQVVAYDFGIKHNILRRLASFGCKLTVVPATYPASEVMKLNPDGVFFSNGPVRTHLDALRTDPALLMHVGVLVAALGATPLQAL
jgi:carbamoylphosphate synthase small subunit